MTTQPPFTHAEIRERFDYDPETGKFTYTDAARKASRRIQNSGEAGYLIKIGREKQLCRMIEINDKAYYNSKMAIFWMTGLWLPGTILRVDGDRLNNSFLNLKPHSKEALAPWREWMIANGHPV